jgi:hypothetical protein
MKKDEHQRQEKEKVRGFWPNFLEWWRTPNFSRTNHRVKFIAIIFQAALAIAIMIFGGGEGLVAGFFLLGYIATIIIPEIWGESLCRRFGWKWAMIISFAPLWLPFVLLLLYVACGGR